MLKIKLPDLKLDFSRKKKTSILLSFALIILSISFALSYTSLVTGIRTGKYSQKNSNQFDIVRPEVVVPPARIQFRGDTGPVVEIFKKDKEQSYYKGGRLIQMTTEEEPVLEIWASNYTGLIKINIFKVDDKTLLEFLTHDSDGKQTNTKMDLSEYDVFGSLEFESVNNNSVSQIFPTKEPGIYFIRAEFDGGKINDCVLVRSQYTSVVKEGSGEYIFWTQDIKNMKKVSGGTVTLYNLLDKFTVLGNYYTDSDGITRADLNSDADIAIIKNNKDFSVVPINLRYLNVGYGGDYKYFQFDSVVPRYFTFVDRPIYKPGDIVYFKSIVRNDFDAEYYIPSGYVEVKVTVGYQEEPIYKNNIYISSDGTVSGSFKLPEDAKTGTYFLNVSFPDSDESRGFDYYYWRYSGNVNFQVEYYRKPEYFLDVSSDQSNVVSGDKAKFTISGNYFSGQPLVNKKVVYDVYVSNTYEGYYYYSGGRSFSDDYWYGYSYGGEKIVSSAQVTLNKFGKADVEIDVSAYSDVKKENGYNKRITLVAKYQDPSMNTSTSSKNILVFNGDYSIFRDYKDRDFYSDTDTNLPIIIVPNGNTDVSNINLTAKITKETWIEDYLDGQLYRSHKLEKKELPSITKTTDYSGKVVFSLPKIEDGSYRVVIEGTDNRGNKIFKEFYVGRHYYYSENDRVPLDGFDLSSDKEIYSPSDTLVLNIDSKIPDRDVLVTVERGHVRRYQVLSINDSKAVITMPVLETDLPNIYISVSGFSKNSFTSKDIDIAVSTDSKKLNVRVTPDKEKYKPGDEVILNVETTDVEGNPVSANLAVWAIDKALFEVAYDNLGDIFENYWFERYNDTQTSHSLIGISGNASEGGGGGGGEGLPRDSFEDTAYWNPNVNTDSSGRARLSFKLPDNLTTWVISAIGSTLETEVGNSANEILVTKDVVVRPFLPNILREGDSITLSSMVNNFTNESMYFDVSLDFDSGDIITENYSKSLIESNSLENFSWNISPNKIKDGSELIFTAISGKNNEYNDSVLLKIPVREFGFNQQSCTVGDNEESFPINFSEKINEEKSYVEVSLASGLLGTIPDSVKYLLDYPYGCIEQTTSRFVPLVIAKKNPTYFESALRDRDIDKMIVKGLDLLEKHQRGDGGWAWWHQGDVSDPFITVYVLEYILEAQKLGFELNPQVIDNVKNYVLGLYGHSTYEGEKNVVKDREKVAKSYAWALLQEKDKFIEITDFENMTPDTLSLAIMANYLSGYFDSADKGLEKLQSMAIEQGSNLYWESGDKTNFGSKDASTAFAIRAITTAGGDINYAIKGARYLVKNRTSYYWSNTFATAQIIRAIVDFSEYSEETNPVYSYTVSIDDKVIRTGSVDSPDQNIESIIVSVDDVSKEGSNLKITKDGQGQLYSTVCVNEFITDRDTKELNNGISIKREYLNDAGQRYQKMAVGDVVNVKITVKSKDKESFYGVVVDELPSGLIPINTALKNNYSEGYSGRYGYYNNDMDITENGAIFSAKNIGSSDIGVFQYKAQVISEGTFYVPPATVSLMYDPEFYGRTNSEVVVVGKDSVLFPLETVKNKFEYDISGISKKYSSEDRVKQDSYIGLISLVDLNLLLLLAYGIFQLIKHNVTAFDIRKSVTGYARFIFKTFVSLLKKKITRDKS